MIMLFDAERAIIHCRIFKHSFKACMTAEFELIMNLRFSSKYEDRYLRLLLLARILYLDFSSCVLFHNPY